jgi:hypothetical protein
MINTNYTSRIKNRASTLKQGTACSFVMYYILLCNEAKYVCVLTLNSDNPKQHNFSDLVDLITTNFLT